MVAADDPMSGGYIRENEKILVTLEEFVNPKYTALVVVDMSNDFIYGAGKTAPTPGEPPTRFDKMVPTLVNFVEVCRKVGIPVFWILTHHGPDIDFPAYKSRHLRHGTTPDNLEGTIGAELVSALVPQKGERKFYKHGYDGFTGTDLDVCLKNRGINTLIMSGVRTGTCVDTTLKRGFHLGYYIVLGADITETVDEVEQRIFLERITASYGLVATAKDIARAWGVEMN